MTMEDDDLDALVQGVDDQRVSAALAEATATSPPASIRADLLRAAAASPRRMVEPVPPPELYERRAAALHELTAQLEDSDWRSPTPPYRWTVHGLIAHLLVIERYTAARFGLDGPGVDSGDAHPTGHLALGADDIASELAADPHDTARRWWEATRRVVEHVASEEFDPDAPAELHGWPFSRSSALVARGFELWTHGDDIRRATGRPLEVPAPAELRTMAILSVSSLPFVLPSVAPGVAMVPTRIVLTGDGGGTFDLGGPGDREAVLAVDVVDYCRLVARRIDPEELVARIDGDASTVPHLLQAARAFAV